MFFIHSKKSHQDSKSRSVLVSLDSSKKPKSSLEHRISSSHKSGHHTSHSDWPAAKATLSSINKPMFDSISNTYQTSHVNTHEQLAHTEVDLLEMGAWTYLHESPQYYADTQHQTRNMNERSPCQYHTVVMGFYYTAFHWMQPHIYPTYENQPQISINYRNQLSGIRVAILGQCSKVF